MRSKSKSQLPIQECIDLTGWARVEFIMLYVESGAGYGAVYVSYPLHPTLLYRTTPLTQVPVEYMEAGHLY